MIKALNGMVKKLDVWDIGLTKMAVLTATIVIVKLFPQLLTIDYWLLLVLVILLVLRPLYRLWIKK